MTFVTLLYNVSVYGDDNDDDNSVDNCVDDDDYYYDDDDLIYTNIGGYCFWLHIWWLMMLR